MSKVKFALFTVISILILSFFFFWQKTSFAQTNKYYHLTLSYSQKTRIQLTNISVLPGEVQKSTQDGKYQVELASFSNTKLYQSAFDIPTTILGDDYDPSTGTFIPKTIELENTSFFVDVPYFTNGKEINVFDAEATKILTVPVLQYAKTCGDKICQPQENYISCPQDCPLKTSSAISLTPTFVATKLEKEISVPWIIGGGILIFVLGIGLVIYLRFNKPQNLLQ